MPNHLHWLLHIKGSLSEQVQRFKSYSTRLAWQEGLEGTLWQRSFYDHLVRSPSALHSIAEYILDNPVRAGLVERSERWPFVTNRLEL
jgi:putative transposase